MRVRPVRTNKAPKRGPNRARYMPTGSPWGTKVPTVATRAKTRSRTTVNRMEVKAPQSRDMESENLFFTINRQKRWPPDPTAAARSGHRLVRGDEQHS